MTSLNIDRLLPIYTSIVLLRFEVVDIQKKTKLRVRKKTWLPGGHLENNVTENRQASVYGYIQHA